MARDARPRPIRGNLSASPMRAWGGQGRQLAGLCQAESYLLEDMGIQDAPYWTEKG